MMGHTNNLVYPPRSRRPVAYFAVAVYALMAVQALLEGVYLPTLVGCVFPLGFVYITRLMEKRTIRKAFLEDGRLKIVPSLGDPLELELGPELLIRRFPGGYYSVQMPDSPAFMGNFKEAGLEGLRAAAEIHREESPYR